MTSSTMRQAALIARDAHVALLELRRLVDAAAQKTRAAEMQIVGASIGRTPDGDPLEALRAVSQALQSPGFEAAISEAKSKMSDAVACHTATSGQAKAASAGSL